MPGQRGILGLKKDPKNQVLFMYGGHGEEWPSSDSEDTDYEPGQKRPRTDADLDSDSDYSPSDDQSPHRNESRSSQRLTRKRKLPQKSVSRKPHRKYMKKSTDASNSTHNTKNVRSTRAETVSQSEASSSRSAEISNTPVPRLPVEIWLKVFEFVVGHDGAVPFLCRATRVCREWRDLANLPSLWQKVDLTYGWIKSTDNTLKWLANNKLSECREINLSGWKNLTNSAIKELAENCPGLEVVNVSHCSKLSSEAVRALADGCRNIRSVDLSFTSPVAISPGSLKNLVTQVGPSLRDINLAGNCISQGSFSSSLKSIMSHCRSLETLDLSNTRMDFTVNVEKMQESLPALRCLRLGNCFIRSTQDSLRCQGEGFVKLEELSCASSPENRQYGWVGVTDGLLFRLLHKAKKVRLLDLRGCGDINPWRSIFANSTTSAITDLEELYLAHSNITRYGDFLVPALQQWGHSLRVLDLSWVSPPANKLEEAFASMSHLPSCPLTHLNLAGSSATPRCVLTALDRFHDLKSMDLTSCRAVPRGLKSVHTGPKELSKLRAALREEDSSSETDCYDE